MAPGFLVHQRKRFRRSRHRVALGMPNPGGFINRLERVDAGVAEVQPLRHKYLLDDRQIVFRPGQFDAGG